MINHVLTEMKPQITAWIATGTAAGADAIEKTQENLLEQYPIDGLGFTNGGLIIVSGIIISFVSSIVGIYGVWKKL